MPRQGPANGSPSCWPHSEVWPGLCVYAGCPSLAPLPAAHCLPRRCVGSALHGRFGTTLSPGTVLPAGTIERSISLRSFAQAELLVPRSRTVIRQRRDFSAMAGSTALNGLPVALRLTPVAHSAIFLSAL